jgi:hypothetical protein
VTPVALAGHEGGDDAAVLAARRLAILLHVLFALLADGRRAALAAKGEMKPRSDEQQKSDQFLAVRTIRPRSIEGSIFVFIDMEITRDRDAL